MNRTKVACSALLLAIAWAVPSPLTAQIFGKKQGHPTISIVRDGLPALANPAYGEVMLSGNEALLEPAWLVGSLRDGATGQVLKWNNYLLPDAKPNVKLLTDTVFEGFVDSSASTKAEWLSTLKLNAADRAVAEVVVTRVSVTSVSPKEIDRARLLQEIVQRLPADQRNRYSVVIAYVDIAITATRFQHYEVEGDVAGYGGRIGGDWYYKDKQKTTDHRLVAISAPLQFAVTTFTPRGTTGQAARENPPCYELVSDAIKRGVLPPEKTGLLSVLSCPDDTCPIAIADSSVSPRSPTTNEPDFPAHSPELRFTTARYPSDSLPAATQSTKRYSSMK
ncbi:MAG: hypothetical protein ABSG68_13230 [Thermoguttaceae bacterium]|jgi:hypothetical protein